ncbi:hypothetical protein [Flavobacterium sp. HSC-61S13]|uniref:hypothetical protein n=1 Tax=Flavobacterium sp. HSC-61S13 TaxID=2910963 RepID=UPI00209CE739|nr:hypothetical protein [Flavobacterium sp. HSC-61S13]MCP1996536.1 hypothetical protein [Flavobacterium sp. HSC-61S13]
MKKIIVFAGLFLVGVACGSDDNKIEKVFEPRQVEMETMAQGDYFGTSGEREFRVIREQREWNDLLDNSHVRSYISNPLYFEMDFTQFEIVVVSDIEKLPGGSSIDIVHIIENEKNVIVQVDGLIKGTEALRKNQPFHIVRIPKLSKPVLFELVESNLTDLKFREIWNLREFSPGLAPYHYYEVGDIRWIFTENNQVYTEVNHYSSDYHSKIPMNVSGNYTYTIQGDSIFLNSQLYQYKVMGDTLIVHWDVPADGIELIFLREH